MTNKFVIEENWSESCGQLTNWNNIPSKTVKEYREISELHEFQNDKNLVQLKKGAHLFIFTLKHDLRAQSMSDRETESRYATTSILLL